MGIDNITVLPELLKSPFEGTLSAKWCAEKNNYIYRIFCGE
ncbi:hypothetical protein [uncultured Algibacter sp.]